MGCDIHICTECKKSINGIEKWTNCDNWRINPYYDADKYETKKYNKSSIFDGRDYELFSILADVRNYDDNTPISQPKGLPKDVSSQTKSELDDWGGDGHSHSFLTLKELKEYRKNNKTVKYSGLMTLKNAELVDNGFMPNSWCQGTNMPNYVYREWEYKNSSLDELINNLEDRVKNIFRIYYDEELPNFEDKIRIVFWFDN